MAIKVINLKYFYGMNINHCNHWFLFIKAFVTNFWQSMLTKYRHNISNPKPMTFVMIVCLFSLKSNVLIRPLTSFFQLSHPVRILSRATRGVLLMANISVVPEDQELLKRTCIYVADIKDCVQQLYSDFFVIKNKINFHVSKVL